MRDPISHYKNCSSADGGILRGVVFFILFMTLARAEPVASMAHIPYLWTGVVILALIVGIQPLMRRKKSKIPKPLWITWLVAILLVLGILLFIGPIIVGFGSILITGRMM